MMCRHVHPDVCGAVPPWYSLESEAGIYDAKFDMTGTRLITCEADKSIKMWRENEEAVRCFDCIHARWGKHAFCQ